MKKIFIPFAVTVSLLVVSLNELKAQSVAINTDGTVAHSSAMLDIKSITKGLLAPRMTQAQRDLISSPAAGLLIYQTDNVTGYYYYNGSAWIQFSTGSATNFWTANGNMIYSNNAGSVGIGTNNPFFKLTVQNAGYGIIHTDGAVRVGTYIGDDGSNAETYGGWLGTQTNHPLMFFTNNGNPQMTIKQSGNVGIGTNFPDFKLTVKSNIIQQNNNTHVLALSGRNPVLAFTDETGVSYGYIKMWSNAPFAPYTNGLVIGANPGYPLFFSTNNYGVSMTVADNGNVGIGVSNPVYNLDIGNRIRLRSGPTANESAGLWLNNLTNSAPIAFIGTADNTTTGIYGTAAGWALAVNVNSGNVGIGTLNPTYKLSVNGNVRSKEVVVETGWADYVFDKSYKLRSLDELENFIRQNNHLPNIPSAKEVEEKGLSLGDTQKRMMEKIEELTLYVIELKKEIEDLKTQKK